MTGFSPAVVAQILDRDSGRCVLCGTYVDPDARGYAWSVHHRRPRGMGGSRNPQVTAASNGVVLCGSGTTGCHGWVESHRTEAMASGLIVPQWQDPELVPVMHWLYGLAFLTPDGWAAVPKGPDGLLAVAARAHAIAEARGLTEDGLTHISEALHELTRAWVTDLEGVA